VASLFDCHDNGTKTGSWGKGWKCKGVGKHFDQTFHTSMSFLEVEIPDDRLDVVFWNAEFFCQIETTRV
jgi:hypothetical protein